MFQKEIVKKVSKGHIKWQRHALQRMMERDISRKEVKQVLIKGELIEEYPDDFPLPSGLFLGFIKNENPLHIVAAVDSEVNTHAHRSFMRRRVLYCYCIPA